MESDGCREGVALRDSGKISFQRLPGTAYSLGESTWRSELGSRNSLEVGRKHDPRVEQKQPSLTQLSGLL